MKNELYKKISTYPSNELYYVAHPENFQKGYNYYKKESVSKIQWSQAGKRLSAWVRAGSTYHVVFSLTNGAIEFECGCSAWSSDKNCEHVVCAFLTIKNLISPRLFIVENQTALRKKMLRKMLAGAPSLEDRHEILKDIMLRIESGVNSGIKLSVLKNGIKLTPHSTQLSRDIGPLVTASLYPWMIEDALLEFFRTNKEHPVIIHKENSEIPLRWDPSLPLVGKIELNAKSDRVIARRICFLNGKPIENILLLGNRLVADIEGKRLGMVSQPEIWSIWDILENASRHGAKPDTPYTSGNGGQLIPGALEMPTAVFNDIHLSFSSLQKKKFMDGILFKSKNSKTVPATGKKGYSLTIQRTDNADCMILKAESHLYDKKSPPTTTLFKYLAPAEDSYNNLFKTKKRRKVLVQALLAILSAKNSKETRKIISETVSDNDFFPVPKIKAEASFFLEGSYRFYTEPHERIGVFTNTWHTVPVDMKKEALLYAIPYNLFGWELFEEMRRHDEMKVSTVSLYEGLESLMSLLSEQGIDVFFEGKPVVSSKWDFHFDVSRNKGIDWFDIRPEIRCNGKRISNQDWLNILKGIGVVEEKNAVRILDADSRRILQTLSSMLIKKKRVRATRSDGRTKKKQVSKKNGMISVSRLQILDWIALRKKGVKVHLAEQDERLVKTLTSFEGIEKKSQPRKFIGTLRDYQKEGYYWLAFLYEHRFGACLADDMGLGKTIQAIALLAGIHEGILAPPLPWKGGPHLVVLPPSLIFNWQQEIEKFYPSLQVTEYIGLNRKFDFSGVDIILTTYDIVHRDIDKFREIHFHVIIFDEAQAIKNIFAKRTISVRQLNGYFKLAMTGTPLQNHIGEYYSILDLCLPGLLEEYDTFKEYTKDSARNLERLIQRTRPFVLRRTKEKILKELPAKTETDIYLDLSEHQKALYKKMVEQVKETIDDAYQANNPYRARIIALTAILRLRQICVAPGLIDANHNEPSPKIVYIVEKLLELREEGHSALVFSQFTSFLDLLEEEMKKEGVDYFRMDGSTPVNKRKGLVENFQKKKDAGVFLMSLKTGGVGLNLIRASYVFHLDPWWNPAVENQASDRAHRIGQKRKVFITKILMRHTIEEKMVALKEKKLSLYKVVMEDGIGERSAQSLTKNDFDFLLD